ncbi:MAG: hypothetical protein N2315_09450, partial [Thermanaerothrix sp.]|nr:hypothetical protein [Thermanaerothrix sp.]
LWTDQGIIEAGHISGVTIKGSTIIGSTFRTSPTGDRLVMDSEGLTGYPGGSTIGFKLLFDQLQFWKDGQLRGVLRANSDIVGYFLELRASQYMRLMASGETFLDSNGLYVQIYTVPYSGGPKQIFEFTPEGDLVVPKNLSTEPGSGGGVKTEFVYFRPLSSTPAGAEGRVFYKPDDYHLRLFTPYGWRTIALTSDIPTNYLTSAKFERRSGTVSADSPTVTLNFSGTINKVLGVWSGHQKINAAQTGGGEGYSYITITAAHIDAAGGWSGIAVYAAVLLA